MNEHLFEESSKIIYDIGLLHIVMYFYMNCSNNLLIN